MPLALFAWVIFEVGSHFFFLLRLNSLQSFYITLPTVAGMTGMHRHAQLFLHWDGSYTIFLSGLDLNHDPPDLSLPSS
jgi:hypothetical protein